MKSNTIKAIIALAIAGSGAFSVSYAVTGISPVSSVTEDSNPIRIRIQNVKIDTSEEPTPDPTNAPSPDPTQEPTSSPEPSPTQTQGPTSSPTPFGTGAPRKPPTRQPAPTTLPSPTPTAIILPG